MLQVRTVCVIVAVVVLWCPLAAAQKLSARCRDAMVKIYAVRHDSDYYIPWRMLNPRNTSGSGCIIRGNRILTNAHVVANHTFLQVRRHGQARRLAARLVAVSHEADLALLTVDDPAFFEGISPLELGRLPETQDQVLVLGFPFGGDSLSVTQGVLSRVEHQSYHHSSTFLLAGQIDAAINPGNSGGPVLVDNRIVGVIMQAGRPHEAENIGFMVPAPVIRHFLKDLSDGTHDGIPALSATIQKMENPDLAAMYKMGPDQSGVLVTDIDHQRPEARFVREGDVILAIDGHEVADDGTVEFRPSERTHCSFFIDQHQMGEAVDLTVLRDGQVKDLSVVLASGKHDFELVPAEQYDRRPRYFIYGGIVFTVLTKNYIERWGRDWKNNAPDHLVARLDERPSDDRRELVIAGKVLPADINFGYHDIHAMIMDRVNGVKYRDFDDFYRLTNQAEGPYTVFEAENGFRIVFDKNRVRESRDIILSTYRVPSDRAENLSGP